MVAMEVSGLAEDTKRELVDFGDPAADVLAQPFKAATLLLAHLAVGNCRAVFAGMGSDFIQQLDVFELDVFVEHFHHRHGHKHAAAGPGHCLGKVGGAADVLHLHGHVHRHALPFALVDAVFQRSLAGAQCLGHRLPAAIVGCTHQLQAGLDSRVVHQIPLVICGVGLSRR
ncbi:hypothetical protein LH459_15025 [Laribacter hongkongensis]|nr:hypothetical protein [Laribacter hongkongensis]MCG9068979.1 hypothetical protein [Laribacter hongkongensis]MCG9087739.1 hypothetical protein [Laribacter hongkongensis]MCG9110854.1 hypothetical protein [Laribacter hongkongensis]MCG9122698.1 hypothetical protein [Laribacter hongkongensis]